MIFRSPIYIFLGAISTLLTHILHHRTTTNTLPYSHTEKTDSTTTHPHSNTDQTDSTRNPIRILWNYWLDASFLVNICIAALFIIIVVAITGGIVVIDTDQTLTEQTESDMRYSSGIQHSQTDFWVSSMERQSELISNSGIITGGTDEELDTYLTDQLSNLPEETIAIHYIQFNDNDDATLITSTADTDSIESSPWNDVRATDFTDQTTVLHSKPYSYSVEDSTSLTTETPAFAFITPTRDNSNQGVVIVVNLRQASQRLNAPDNGRSFVVNHDGTIVLATNPQDIGNDAYELDYITPDLWEQAYTETSAYATTYYDDDTILAGERFVTSMAHTDQADWVAYTQRPYANAFGLRDNIQTSMIILLGSVLLSIGIVGALIGIPTIRDLRQLSETTQRVSDGNYDDPIIANRSDEIGQVFRDVDEMRLSLRNRINEVEDLNDRLQRIVQEQSTVMESVADGDLTQSMSTTTGLPALDGLARDFNNMVGDVRRMVIELEKSEEEMQEFMFIATHDLREPLRMIDTYTDLLETEYADEFDEEGREYMDFIANSSNRIDAMIEDLYAYLRAKTHDNTYEHHNINTIVETVQQELQEDINNRNATITVENLPTVRVDDRQLNEVFQNLIGNALQYAKEDEPPHIEITGKSNDNTKEHIIKITDNGIGIPENQYDKIFEVFSRVERDDNDTGTGIGLAICKRIIEDHDGRIWVDSEQGVGTTFYIALPYETRTMQDKFTLDRDDDDTSFDVTENNN